MNDEQLNAMRFEQPSKAFDAHEELTRIARRSEKAFSAPTIADILLYPNPDVCPCCGAPDPASDPCECDWGRETIVRCRTHQPKYEDALKEIALLNAAFGRQETRYIALLDVAIARGVELQYEDADYLAEYKTLTGKDWEDEEVVDEVIDELEYEDEEAAEWDSYETELRP